jgi:hypothetical protein
MNRNNADANIGATTNSNQMTSNESRGNRITLKAKILNPSGIVILPAKIPPDHPFGSLFIG